MKKGIDVSSYQNFIDWGKVKNAGIEFAILRLGYGDDVYNQDDSQFLNNANGCIKNGIPFGVYIYSYAKNLSGSESIESEVKHTKRLLNKLSIKPFCVYIDMEDSSTEYLKKLMLTNFALEYCKQIKAAGYNAGVYANENWFRNFLDCSKITSYGYSIWCAKYSSNKPVITSNYDIWQYSSSEKIDGISGNVDTNYMYNNICGTQNATQTTNVNVTYRVKTVKHGWLSEVTNLNDYAGYQDSPITGVAIKVDKGTVKYRVHTKNGKWFSYVTGYNINDISNGYAGNGANVIDCIEVYYNTPDNIRPYKKAKYKINNYSWQYDNEKTNGQDGYAGSFGVAATKFQIVIE